MKTIQEWYGEARECIENQLGGSCGGTFNFREASSRKQGVNLCITLFQTKCKENPELETYTKRLEKYGREIKSKIKTK